MYSQAFYRPGYKYRATAPSQPIDHEQVKREVLRPNFWPLVEANSKANWELSSLEIREILKKVHFSEVNKKAVNIHRLFEIEDLPSIEGFSVIYKGVEVFTFTQEQEYREAA